MAEAKKKQKRPTADKRLLQDEKKKKVNHAFKSKLRTNIRVFLEGVEKQEATATKENLSSVFSLLDKGVKRGILKKNTASRKKSRLQKKVLAA